MADQNDQFEIIEVFRDDATGVRTAVLVSEDGDSNRVAVLYENSDTPWYQWEAFSNKERSLDEARDFAANGATKAYYENILEDARTRLKNKDLPKSERKALREVKKEAKKALRKLRKLERKGEGVMAFPDGRGDDAGSWGTSYPSLPHPPNDKQP